MQLRANTNWGDLAKKFEEISSKGKSSNKKVDERFYVPGKDKDGNIAAVIRFLPSPDSPAILEEATHFIKGPTGKVYSENCIKNNTGYCPACSWIGSQYGNGDKNAYKKWGSKSKYISNILVINDVNNPENNGKVFLYRFGKVLYNMIEAKVNPQDGLDEPSIVFDYFEGENFKLVGNPSTFIVNGKQRDYDDFKKSEFKGKSRLGTDEEIERVDAQLHSMAEWLPENLHKSFDELKVILDEVINGPVNGTPVNTPINPVVQKAQEESAADAEAIDKLVNGETQQPKVEDEDLMAKLNSIRAEL